MRPQPASLAAVSITRRPPDSSARRPDVASAVRPPDRACDESPLAGLVETDTYYRQIPRKPSEYLKKLYIDTALGWHKPAFECARALVGIEHIVYGTDYFMQNSEFMNWTNAFLDSLDLSKGDKEKIYSGNAERFLKL